MAHLTLEFKPEARDLTKDAQSKLLDEEIDAFSKFMEGLNDFKASGPLLPMERAIIKTYMIWKLKGEK